MTGAKVMVASVIGAAVWEFAASAWEQVAHSVALELAVLAAGVTGAGVLWKKLVKPVGVKAWTVIRKIDAIYEVVKGMPEWQASMEKRLADGAQHFDRLDAELAVWASADRARVSAKIDELHDPRGRS